MDDDDEYRDPELDPETEPFWHHASRLLGQIVIVVILMLIIMVARH